MLQLKHFSGNTSLSCVIKIDLKDYKDYPVQELVKEDSDYRYVLDYKNMEFRQYYKGKLMGKCNLKNNIIDGVVDINEWESLGVCDVSLDPISEVQINEANEGKANLVIPDFIIKDILSHLWVCIN